MHLNFREMYNSRPLKLTCHGRYGTIETNRYSRLAGVILIIFFCWYARDAFAQRSTASNEDACAAEKRAYYQAQQSKEFVKVKKGFVIDKFISTVLFGVLIGSWFNTGFISWKRAVVHGIAGGIACAVAGSVAGIIFICLIDIDSTALQAQGALDRLATLIVVVFLCCFASAFRPPLPELLTVTREFREKQMQMTDAYLLFENCREKHNRLSGRVEEQ